MFCSIPVHQKTVYLTNGNLFRHCYSLMFCALLMVSGSVLAADAGFPGRNVNVVGPPPIGSGQPQDVGLRQQNEPSCAVNPANTLQICCGYNDYRGIDIPEMGDAWEGLSCSRNGGQSWHSQLIPGHGADPEHSLNLDFAADPNLVAAPGGLFYNFIAADRDHVGGIYVQQFAWRNKEDGWPLIQVGGPILISKGTNGRFIDKPHMIGFLDDDSDSTVTMSWSDANGASTRILPAGNLGMAAAVFVGNDNNDGTKILYWNSSDWGKTWGHATKLTESKGVNSGINLSANGDTVCAVWRRFNDTNETDSIFSACSSNRGKTFSKPKLIADVCPFDQVTLNGTAIDDKDIVSFRTNAFPAIAGDGNAFYTFWSDRGYAAASNFGEGCNLRDADNGFNPSYGRIVYSKTSNGGKNWSNPEVIEDAPQGHQFMPAAFGANGEVVVSWIDNRDDIANILPIDNQLIVDIWRADDALYRHTTDIRSARLVGNGGNISFTPSVKVSSYTSGLFTSGNTVALRQMEYNLVNARLFQQGTAPFIGDYLSVTAAASHKNAAGKWVNSNTEPVTGSPTFHVSWGDNRDVRGNAWGSADAEGFNGPSPYTPSDPNSVNAAAPATETSNAAPAVQDPPDNQQIYCSAATVKADRTRDQNVYSAPLYPLAIMRSPGAVKITGQVQRALPVYLENYSSQARYFQLQISGPTVNQPGCEAVASFRQTPNQGAGNCGEVTSIFTRVYPRSSAVRTVFQTSANETLHGIEVRALDCGSDMTTCELVSSIVLNQDPLELGGNLEQPDFDTFNSILTQELHNPDLLNPDLLNPDLLNVFLQNPDLLNPDLLNPDLLNPDLLNLVLDNPDLLNPDLLNKLIDNPDLLNPDLLNNVVLNPDLLNPDLLNLVIDNPDLLNIIVANPDLLNPDLLNLVIDNPDLLNPDLLNAELTALSVENPDLLNPDLLNVMISNPDLLNPDLLNAELLNPDLLNPDLLNPDLLNAVLANPDLLNPDLLNLLVANPDLLNPDLLNVSILNPDLLNPDLLNPDLLNPDLLNPDLLNPDLLNLILLNPDLLNPDLLNPDLLNPDLLNPDLLNPDLLNLLVSNPDLLNPDLLNPDLLNPDLLNPDLLNAVVSYSDIQNPDIANDEVGENADSSYIDVTWQVKNDGNTTTGYMAQPYIAGPQDHTATQLIVSKPYLRQTTRNCLPVLESDNQVVVNIYNPPNQQPIINPNPEDEEVQGLASYWLAPGEVANVTLRIFADDPADLHSGRVGMYVNSQACNSDQECNDQPFVITARDADYTGPELTPDFISSIGDVEATGPDGATVTFTVPTAYDAGDGQDIPVVCDFESGTTFPIGTTSNSCGASDSAGNATLAPFVVEVQDSIAPNINIAIPEEFPMPVEAVSGTGTVVDFDGWIAVEDVVDPSPSVACVPASGSEFPIGITSVLCTVTDSSGNSDTSVLQITVADSIAPVLTVPSIEVTAEASDPGGALVEFAASATDDVDGSVNIACSAVSGSLFALGTTTVTCTATDFTGNVSSASFDILVKDTTPPELIVPPGITEQATSPNGATVTFAVTVVDAVYPGIVPECGPGSGGVFPLGPTLVVCSATDGSGNTQTAGFTVSVVDTITPIVTMPDPIVLEATEPAGTLVTYAVTAADIADDILDISCAPESGTIFPLGATTISCTATDDSGNVGSGSVTATVTDTTAPVLTVPDDMLVSAQSDTGAIVDFVASATDIVDTSVDVICTPASGTEFGFGETIVSCVATDDAGLTSNGTFSIQVRTDIIWITPIDDPHNASLGPNLNLRWGYGVGGVLQDSGDMIDKPPGKGTDPIEINYLGADCDTGNPQVVDLDAGKSSLRYSSSEWQLNWQTGQSTLNGGSLVTGCYVLEIPRAAGNGGADTKQIILN